jgi:hypothetical protein
MLLTKAQDGIKRLGLQYDGRVVVVTEQEKKKTKIVYGGHVVVTGQVIWRLLASIVAKEQILTPEELCAGLGHAQSLLTKLLQAAD